MCAQIKAKDNQPPFRDEQRAWYDTLRDFLPVIKGLKPTVRLFSRDAVWCDFDPQNPSDVNRFKDFLGFPSKQWEIEVRQDPNPSIARIIIAGEWKGNPVEAKHLLEDIFDKWPKGKRATFLITCGGFIQFCWPKSLTRKEIGNNLFPSEDAVRKLMAEGEKLTQFVLDEDLCQKYRDVTHYITLGIDSLKEKISTTGNYIGELHAELVFLKDFKNGRLYKTGKSYPTSRQQNGLVRVGDLKTHFINLPEGKALILGCHDLNVFNPRAKNGKGWRREVNLNFRDIAKKEQPRFALHHPHTTVKKRTWLSAWRSLSKKLTSLEHFAGSGRYSESKQENSEWDSLEDVLQATKFSDTIDFIVKMKD